MENHDTFTPSNILDLENWFIVGAALWKMAAFFSPAILAVAVFLFIEHKREKANDNR